MQLIREGGVLKTISTCFAVILLVRTLSANAAPTPLAIAFEKFDGHSRAERVRYAKGVLNAVNSIKAGLPLLKPSEAEWIRREQDEIDKLIDINVQNDRAAKLYILSPEYQHQQLEISLNNMRDGLECVLNSNSGSREAIQREIFCWAAVGLALNSGDFESMIQVTQNSGRLSLTRFEVSGGKVDEKIFANVLRRISNNIQVHIVIPYLKGDKFTK